MKKLYGFLLALMAFIVTAMPVLAAVSYIGKITVTSAAAYNYLPITTLMNVEAMITNGYITPSATDLTMDDGSYYLRMMPADDRINFVANVTAGTSVFTMRTNNETLATEFPIIPGYGGNVTVNDAAALEPGNSTFTFTTLSRFDTSSANVGKPLIYKEGAFRVYEPAAGQLKAEVTGGENVTVAISPGYHQVDTEITEGSGGELIESVVSQGESETYTEYKQYNKHSLARASDGTLWVTYVKTDSNGDNDEIYVSHSHDGGVTWEGETQISNSDYEAGNPNIAIDSQDHVHVVWDDDSIQGAGGMTIRYRKYTTSWQVEDTLYNPGGTIQTYGNNIAVDGNDELHVVFTQYGGAITAKQHLLYRNCDAGVWNTVEEIGNSTVSTNYWQQDSDVAVDDNNDVHVAWKLDYDNTLPRIVQYSWKNTSLGIWSTPLELARGATNSDAQLNEHIVVDEANTVHILWKGSGYLRHIYKTSGGSWSAIENFTSAQTYFSVSTDPDNHVHVVWGTMNDEIIHMERTTSWQSPETIVEQPPEWFYNYAPVLMNGHFPVVGGEHTNLVLDGDGYKLTFIGYLDDPDYYYQLEFYAPAYGSVSTISLTVDGGTPASSTLTVAVPDTANDWIILDGSLCPYATEFRYTLNGTLVLDYKPSSLINDAILPDKAGTAQNGLFSWGTNPGGVTSTLTSFKPKDEAKATSPIPPRQIINPTGITGNFSTGVNPTDPWGKLIKSLADASSTPAQLPILIIFAFITLAIGLSVSYVLRKHGNMSLAVKIAVCTCFMVIGWFTTIVDLWMLFIYWVFAGTLGVAKGR